MIEMATKPEFRVNLKIFSDLIGTHKGNNSGKDLIFMDRSYITRVMKINSPFYKEALMSTSIFDRKKGISIVNAWDNENIFHNPLIKTRAGKTLRETEYFRQNRIFTLGKLLQEKAKETQGQPFDRKIVSLLEFIILDMDVKNVDIVNLGNTQK